MKSLGLPVILLLFQCCNSKSVNPVADDKNEEEFYATIAPKFYAIDNLKNTMRWDSTEQLVRELPDIIMSYKDAVFDFRDTLNFDLVYLAKSNDKKICMVSWDTRQGGMMIEYATILFYKTNKGILAKYLTVNDIIGAESSNTMMHYNYIYELHAADRTIYLAQGFGQGSSALPWEQVKAIEIKNDTIIYPAIFPGYEEPLYSGKLNNKIMTDAVFVEFDLHNVTGNRNQRPITEFLDSNKTLKVPKTTDKGGNTNDYFILKFDGQKYQEQN